MFICFQCPFYIMVTKVEWEAIKARANYKCLMCGGKEGVEIPTLEKAHLKAESKGGTQIIPLCPNCHTTYDSGKCTAAQLAKIGVRPEHYKRVQPKKPSASVSAKPQRGMDLSFGMSSPKPASKSRKSSGCVVPVVDVPLLKSSSKPTSKSRKSGGYMVPVVDISLPKSSSKSKSKKSKNDFDSLFGFR